MHRRARYAWIGAAAAGLAAYAALHAWRIRRAAALARRARPFSHVPAAATESWLVVGDSTAVGVGASAPGRSLAGRLGAAHAGLAVINLGRNGARYPDVARQLRAAPGRYDTVLVLAGSNELFAPQAWEDLEWSLREVLREAKRLASRVVLMPGGNLGHATLFSWPISTWLAHRSRKLRQLEARIAAEEGVVHVNLLRDARDDPFAREPHRFLAADGMHPSDEGYGLWYRQLVEQARPAAG